MLQVQRRTRPGGLMAIEPLQHFEVVETDGDLGTLMCPREDCEGEFTVDRTQFKEQLFATSMRLCPYCARVSIIPGRRIPQHFDKEMVPFPY